MAVAIKPELERLFREEKIAWLTTMRGDGSRISKSKVQKRKDHVRRLQPVPGSLC